MVKLELSSEGMDALMISLITKDYECCYYSYRKDCKNFKNQPIPEHWIDQFDMYETTLRAYENLMDYYGGSQFDLQRIRDRIDYGDKIIRGMSGATK
jgi:hypothetical protein